MNSVASFIFPTLMDGYGKQLKFSTNEPRYPISTQLLSDGYKSDTILMRGDIFLPHGIINKNMYLVDEDYTEPIYAQVGDVVVRPKKISSEYLYLFMNSDLFSEMIKMSFQMGLLPKLTRSSIKRLSIPLPKKSNEEYRIYVPKL